jgi:hypothetical protein
MNCFLALQIYETYDGGASGIFYMGFDDAWLLVLLRGHVDFSGFGQVSNLSVVS